MINRSNMVSGDSRLNIRVPENKKVVWYLQGSNSRGGGRVKNISSTGMLLKAGPSFVPRQDSLFNFDSDLGHDNFVPRTAQLIWYKPTGMRKKKYLCGFRFVDPSEYISTKLRQRVQQGIFKKSSKHTVKNTFEVIFSMGILFLTVLTAWVSHSVYKNLTTSNEQLLSTSSQQSLLTQSYSNRLFASQMQLESARQDLSTTRSLYAQSQGMLTGVQQELDTTRAILAETEVLLEQARLQNANTIPVSSGINEQQLAETKNELESTINLLQDKSGQLTSELEQVRVRLEYYEGNVTTIEDGHELLDIYRNKMKLVQEKVAHFQRQAKELSQSAQRENDRIKLALGNNGYLFKGGETVNVDYNQYNSVGKKSSSPISISQADKKVAINVEIVE